MSENDENNTRRRRLPTAVEESNGRERAVRVLWPVGDPDEEGYQTYARLLVSHFGREFRAGLRRIEIKREGPITEEKFELLGTTVLVDATPVARFSAKRLAGFAAASRALVEQRYAAGDRAVVEMLGG